MWIFLNILCLFDEIAQGNEKLFINTCRLQFFSVTAAKHSRGDVFRRETVLSYVVYCIVCVSEFRLIETNPQIP